MDPKKPKPGIARSLLQRVSSRNDVTQEDAPAKSDTTSPISPATRHTLSQEMPNRALPPPQATVTIEQSVRMFRLYEALRSGDTAAISKAIKETTTAKEEIDTEPSTPSQGTVPSAASGLDGTSILHLAVQCADLPVIEYVLSNAMIASDVNNRDKDGNTPLHVAAQLSRAPVVRTLLAQKGINDSVLNYQGRTAVDVAKSPEVYQQLQLARSMYIDEHIRETKKLVAAGDYEQLEKLLVDSHFQTVVDVNWGDLATDPATTESGGTLLHEAARKRNIKLIQILLLNGADPFRRDRKGRLPQDVTKDDRTKAILKKSPAAVAAQRGIQEKTILGSAGPQATVGAGTGEHALGGKEGREMKGYLRKWVNYTTGYKLRWFILEDGILSYYKNQDDHGSACRGAINMKIAKLHMDAQDKLRFEIIGKSSVKYHLKANHQVEAKRWFWALNNAIQFGKDEAKEAEKAQSRSSEMLRQAKLAQTEKMQSRDADSGSLAAARGGAHLVPGPATGATARSSIRTGSGSDMLEEEDGIGSTYDESAAGDEPGRLTYSYGTTAIEGDNDDNEEYGEDASEAEAYPVKKDAFVIAAHSARLQLEMLSQISAALQQKQTSSPSTHLSDPIVVEALTSYDAAVANLNGLVGDLGRIARDRESFWQYRLEQETNVRRIWEDNMLRVAQEQEELENRIGQSEEKRKQAKRALRDMLDGQVSDQQVPAENVGAPRPVDATTVPADEDDIQKRTSGNARLVPGARRKSTMADITNIAASDDEDGDDEFFDAVDAGEFEVDEMPAPVVSPPLGASRTDGVFEEAGEASKSKDIQTSFRGYEEPVRKRLKMDADNRPKISLWGILKSMIGKDMTKMTLPVSFNEPTSLLQRVAEDMEYTDLLDMAADRADPTERMIYVAAFAASEYASTIGRVAKPFNPLLGETYEYVRPDKGYRFFVEQVSHHPPIGAAWAESQKWDYYGESAVKSKFYGKSFDINPLGTWFLKLRPTSDSAVDNGSEGGSAAKSKSELYTWKKVTSSVIGIITGAPTVDNYGSMEIRNHTTGEVCILDFKPRGWKASSAYQVIGKVLDRNGNTRWSIGGRWNDKIYARLTPGFEDSSVITHAGKGGKDQAFLVWEANSRPQNIPFNLTPFVLTLNAIPEALKTHLPPTDTRLRPDQRAMEDGEYDLAATEKNRVEVKQRAARRARELKGEEFEPQWFRKGRCNVTGEEYWIAKGSEEDDGAYKGIEYWSARKDASWTGCADIF